jgi:hypothetical protein
LADCWSWERATCFADRPDESAFAKHHAFASIARMEIKARQYNASTTTAYLTARMRD